MPEKNLPSKWEKCFFLDIPFYRTHSVGTVNDAKNTGHPSLDLRKRLMKVGAPLFAPFAKGGRYTAHSTGFDSDEIP